VCSSTANNPKIHAASLAQFVLSLLALLFSWGIAFFLVLAGLLQRFAPPETQVDALPFFLASAGALLIGFLLMPSAIYAWKAMSGAASPTAVTVDSFLLPLAAILLFPLAIWLGDLLVGNDQFAWLLLPPLHIIAISLPILLLVYLGIRKITVGSPQRLWGLLASGTFLAPVLIFSVEIIGIIILIIGGAIWLSTQPELLSELKSVVESLQELESNPAAIQGLLAPYLTRPGVILVAFAFTALFVPLVEELLKPIGVWFLVRSALTPAGGFAAGVLCGAGYALFESLGIANSGELWSGLVLARMGTAAVHIFTTALSGWALVIAWKENRYLLLGAIYLLNVLVHGLWNAFTLTIVISEFPRVGSVFLRIARIGEYAPYILICLTVLTFTGLVAMNRRLSQNQPGDIALESSGIIPPIAKETDGPDI
jgi:hypothetical protein